MVTEPPRRRVDKGRQAPATNVRYRLTRTFARLMPEGRHRPKAAPKGKSVEEPPPGRTYRAERGLRSRPRRDQASRGSALR